MAVESYLGFYVTGGFETSRLKPEISEKTNTNNQLVGSGGFNITVCGHY